MACPRLKKCCWYFDLKTGNIILGCFVAVMSFGLFTTMLVVAIALGDIEKNIEKHLQILSEMEGVEEDTKLRGFYAMSIIMVYIYLAKFLFDLFFIYGVCVERSGIIRSYLITWVFFVLLSVFVFFCNASYYEIKIVATEIFYLVLNVYLVVISYSYYAQINRKEVV